MKKSFYLIFLITLVSGCAVDQEITNIDSLCDAIAQNDDQSVRKIIDEICIYYEPEVSTADPYGHQNNLNQIIININEKFDCANASLVCYACIETNPPTSEIRIETTVDSIFYYVVIDLLTPKNNVMEYKSMH